MSVYCSVSWVKLAALNENKHISPAFFLEYKHQLRSLYGREEEGAEERKISFFCHVCDSQRANCCFLSAAQNASLSEDRLLSRCTQTEMDTVNIRKWKQVHLCQCCHTLGGLSRLLWLVKNMHGLLFLADYLQQKMAAAEQKLIWIVYRVCSRVILWKYWARLRFNLRSSAWLLLWKCRTEFREPGRWVTKSRTEEMFSPLIWWLIEYDWICCINLFRQNMQIGNQVLPCAISTIQGSLHLDWYLLEKSPPWCVPGIIYLFIFFYGRVKGRRFSLTLKI